MTATPKKLTATIEDGYLVIKMPLNPTPTRSATGKTLVVASSHGNKQTDLEIAGKPVSGRVTDAIASGLIPWRMKFLPRSAVTGRAYSGIDPLLLQIAASRMGCTSPFWATAEGGQAIGCRVVRPSDQGVLLSSGEAVLNWEQTDRAHAPAVLRRHDPAPVFDAIVNGLGVRVEYGFDATCKYYGGEDKIRMPHRLLFEAGPGGLSGFWDALGHELFHASEHRVRWDAHPDVNELRAEIGSGYLLGALGVQPLPRHLTRHHDAHVPRWLRLLRQEGMLLLKVCLNVVFTLNYLFRLAGQGDVVNFASSNLVLANGDKGDAGAWRFASWRGN